MTQSIEKADANTDRRAAKAARCGIRGKLRRLKRAARRQGNGLVTVAVAACAVTVGTLVPRTGEAKQQPAPQPAPVAEPSAAASVSSSPAPQATPVHHTRRSATHVTLTRLAVAAPSGCHRVRPSSHDSRDAGAGLVHAAERLVGCPYRFGGASSEGFDCSGLMWYVHHVMHMPIPRRAEDQSLYAAEVSEDQLQPGDLLFFHFAQGDPRGSHLDFAPSYINHVGLYIGGGRFIHAPKTGKYVQYGRLEDFKPYFLKAGRYWSGSSSNMLARR